MDKKTECEIVQDLLISYVDNVLNPESKKIVEKHILECDMCKNKFEAIQNDVKEQENVKSKEIDYLKKIRRKAKLKSILFGIVIVFIVFFMYYSYNFIILNNISNKIHKQFQMKVLKKELCLLVKYGIKTESTKKHHILKIVKKLYKNLMMYMGILK